MIEDPTERHDALLGDIIYLEDLEPDIFNENEWEVSDAKELLIHLVQPECYTYFMTPLELAEAFYRRGWLTLDQFQELQDNWEEGVFEE